MVHCALSCLSSEMRCLVRKGEHMRRKGGGGEGLPLPACHWLGMTAFSPETPSSSIHPVLLFALPPPSICVPSLSVALLITTGALALALRTRRRAAVSGLFIETFPLRPFLPWMLPGSFSLSLLYLRRLLLFLLLLAAFPQHYICPLPRPLQWSRPC